MNPTTAEPEVQAEERVQTLTALDRCDACGAQAYVSVIISTGGLLFCGHHYSSAEEKLSALNPEVTDERYRLFEVAKLDVSA